MSSVVPINPRTVLGKMLRSLENLIDELQESNAFPGKLDLLLELMYMRGVTATLLQWEIEEDDHNDLPF